MKFTDQAHRKTIIRRIKNKLDTTATDAQIIIIAQMFHCNMEPKEVE